MAGYLGEQTKKRRRKQRASRDKIQETNTAGQGRAEQGTAKWPGTEAQTPCITYSTSTPTTPCGRYLGTHRAHLGQRLGRAGKLPSFLASDQAAWGRSRGRLPHHSLSSGQVPCLRPVACEVHVRIRDAARVVPRYQSMMCEVGKRRGGGNSGGTSSGLERETGQDRQKKPTPCCRSIEPGPGHPDIHSLDELQRARWAVWWLRIRGRPRSRSGCALLRRPLETSPDTRSLELAEREVPHLASESRARASSCKPQASGSCTRTLGTREQLFCPQAPPTATEPTSPPESSSIPGPWQL